MKVLRADVELDKILAYEQGELSEAESIKLFQSLIDSGMAWRLQGSYGRTAVALIEAGFCHPAIAVDDGKPALQTQRDLQRGI